MEKQDDLRPTDPEQSVVPVDLADLPPPSSTPSDVPLHTRFWLSLKMGVVGKLLPVWALSLLFSLVVIYVFEGLLADPDTPKIHWWSGRFFLISGISFISMYLNNALGMGYGVTLIPILIFLGFDNIAIMPAVLIPQFLAEISAGISHQSAGNVNLSKTSPHLKVAMVLAACGVLGAPLGAKLHLNLNQINPAYSLLTIGGLIAMGGLIIFMTMGRRFGFSWRKIVGLGVLASLVKGYSGAGYGPIVTGGQVLIGVGGKAAIGVKSIAEGVVCLIGAMAYLVSGAVHDLSLAYPLVLGAICSVPFSAYTVRRLGTKKVTTLIAVIAVILGIALVIKALNM